MEFLTMPRATIRTIRGLAVLDSRGRPTVRAFVQLADERWYAGTAPAGASTGRYESVELRDGGPRYGGRGVDLAVAIINGEIADLLVGRSACDQARLDARLVDVDGTPNRSRLGANAMVAVSMAVARAGAGATNVPLWKYLANGRPEAKPIPLMNVLNGGLHAAGGLRIQECMIVLHVDASSADRIRCGVEVYTALHRRLTALGASTALGDEGGFVFAGGNVHAALSMLVASIEEAGYQPGTEVSLAIDAAANGFFDGRCYAPDADLRLSSKALTAWWGALLNDFPITVLEDPCSEDDWPGWKHLTTELGDHATIVGDDIFVTNPMLIGRGIADGIANAVLLKPNQIGTVTETLEASEVARKAGYKIVVSHRSGETGDTFITDLAVALGADYLKAGAPARGERTEKYNRLLEIEAGL